MSDGSGWVEMLAGVQEGEGKHAAHCPASQQYSNSYLTSELPHYSTQGFDPVKLAMSTKLPEIYRQVMVVHILLK